MKHARNDLNAIFEREFGNKPLIGATAPGRVNLIGEHTDYNDGFVFPIAIERNVTMVAAPLEGHIIEAYSVVYDERASFDLERIEKNELHNWINYIAGVADQLIKKGFHLNGLKLVVTGDVPTGSGLSSSAALEVCSATLFEAANDLSIDPVEKIKLCQKAENEFVGVNCGIMDQFISCLGKKDHALFLDCRSLEYELVPLALEGISIVICNTKVERGLVDSKYNERRQSCEDGARKLGELLNKQFKALRDVSMEAFQEVEFQLEPEIRKRCRHVISENERCVQSVEVLKGGDIEQFGKLMNASHESLRDDYEVTGEALDRLAEIAWGTEGVIGSRMTGAGFGGCTVSLVRDDAIERFKKNVTENYYTLKGLEPEVYVCSVEDGARSI